MGRFSQRVAEDEGTPVHWIVHDVDSDNPHGHALYAGRRLDGAEAFAKKRDTRQDQKSGRGRQSIVDRHRAIWTEVCREFGVEIDFAPQGERAQKHIGPRAWHQERKAIERETAETINSVLDSPADPGDLQRAAAARQAGLTVSEALRMPRPPRTESMLDAPKPQQPAPDVELRPAAEAASAVTMRPAPETTPDLELSPQATAGRQLEVRPAPTPVPDVKLRPGAAVRDVAMRPAPEPAPDRELRPRTGTAPDVELHPGPAPAPDVEIRPQATPAPHVRTRPRPAPSRDVKQRPVPVPVPNVTIRPRPAPAPDVKARPEPRPMPDVKLPKPTQARGHLQDAKDWEADARKQREKAARSRLHTAITVDTTEAVAEKIIENHAGNASAYPSFISHGIGSKASDAAVRALRPHVKPHQVREGDRRTKARTDRQYLDAVKRAIGAFRRWWRGRGWFGGDPPAERIVAELRQVAEPVHLKEAEELHVRITQEIAAKREAERRRTAKQRQQAQYRPQLVGQGQSTQRKPGQHGGHGGGPER